MPITRGQGQSDMTEYKQKDYEEFLGLWFRFAKNALRNKRFRQTIIYIDTNAGSGFNDDYNCSGSPVIFCEFAEKEKVPYLAYLIDEDKAACEKLSLRVKGYNATVICGNNQDVIPNLLNNIPHASLGLIYTDPNGIPDERLIKLITQHEKAQKLDILIRYNTSAVWRNHHNGYHLDKIKVAINKSYKWGKHYYHFDKVWRWSFLFGINYQFDDWQSRGWVRFDTEAGQDLEEKLACGPGQRQKKRQLYLTGLIESTCAIPSLELFERKSLKEQAASVKDAIKGRLRRFTI